MELSWDLKLTGLLGQCDLIRTQTCQPSPGEGSVYNCEKMWRVTCVGAGGGEAGLLLAWLITPGSDEAIIIIEDTNCCVSGICGIHSKQGFVS